MSRIDHSSSWFSHDLESYFRSDTVQKCLSGWACAASICIILIGVARSIVKRRSYHDYKHLRDGGERVQNTFLAPTLGNRRSDDDDEDDYSALELANCNATTTFGAEDASLKVDRPRWTFSTLGVEVIICLAQSLLSIYNHMNLRDTTFDLIFWSYVLLVVLSRVWLVLRNDIIAEQLWFHTASLYSFQWLIAASAFYFAIADTTDRLFPAMSLAGCTILVIISLTTRIGNTAVEMEFEGRIPPAQESRASILSLAVFQFVQPLFVLGYRQSLEMSDIWNLMAKDKASRLVAVFARTDSSGGLVTRLFAQHRSALLKQAVVAVLGVLLSLAPTLLIQAILGNIERPDRTAAARTGWLYVLLLLFTQVLAIVCEGPKTFVGRRICMQVKTVLLQLVNAKALRRSVTAAVSLANVGGAESDVAIGGAPSGGPEADVSKGNMINVMSVDVESVAESASQLERVFISFPLILVLAMLLLYVVLGWTSLAGLFVMLIVIPTNIWMAGKIATVQERTLAAMDTRVDQMNEILTNIRLVKFFAWEPRFRHSIQAKRRVELACQRLHWMWEICMTIIWRSAPDVIALVSFGVHTLVLGEPLLPSTAFTALLLFRILSNSMTDLAGAITDLQQARVSLRRIESFLAVDETQKYRQLRHESCRIGLENATFSWAAHDMNDTGGGGDRNVFRLRDINLEFRLGQLNIIAGPTGGGKSSLLQALLGEMTMLGGRVHLPNQPLDRIGVSSETGLQECVAYCAQQPWLVNASLRENIMFDSIVDEKRYHQVLHACALKPDMAILDRGDLTLVGDKGVVLSGGQTQRVSLARAVYSRARHVILDDIFSAVDSHTARWIFDDVIRGPLMSGRTVILVTHNLPLCLGYARFVAYVDNGRVVEQGSVDEVVASGVLGAAGAVWRTSGTNDSVQACPDALPTAEEDDSSTRTRFLSPESTTRAGESSVEDTATGWVGLPVFKLYLRSMGGWVFWTLFIVLHIAQEITNVGRDVCVGRWADSYSPGVRDPRSVASSGAAAAYSKQTAGDILNVTTHDDTSHRNTRYFGIYAALITLTALVMCIRLGNIYHGGLTAARRLHDSLVGAVLRARFQFFDSTPLGQIVNRFSRNVHQVDGELVAVSRNIVWNGLYVVSTILIVSYLMPAFLVVGLTIISIFVFFGIIYMHASRGLKRLESAQWSPIYQQFGEVLAGVVTIRAYGDERRWLRNNLKQIDTANRPYWYLWMSHYWLEMRVNLTGALVAFFTAAILQHNIGSVDPGLAGLALNYAVSFTPALLWCTRLTGATEQVMNSVERVKEYLELPQEAPQFMPDEHILTDWPARGAITIEDFSTRYRSDLGLVLKKVNIDILPGEKVGIVGRTGAGKSTLALALLRTVEAETGSMVIDGIDIAKIGLHHLRSRVVLVPQDATLFSGTIRMNLDPFDAFTDEDILRVLRQVHLIGSSSSSSTTSGTLENDSKNNDHDLNGTNYQNVNIFRNLSTTISDSGANISQGQRQLLCLARALLRRPKILIMDEATASIDHDTDVKIQSTIRELDHEATPAHAQRDGSPACRIGGGGGGTTIITIAHRLRSIIDYDKIVVLDGGEVVEVGAPWELLSEVGRRDGNKEWGKTKKRRWFYEMCSANGDLQTLVEQAKKARVSQSRSAW